MRCTIEFIKLVAMLLAMVTMTPILFLTILDMARQANERFACSMMPFPEAHEHCIAHIVQARDLNLTRDVDSDYLWCMGLRGCQTQKFREWKAGDH